MVASALHSTEYLNHALPSKDKEVKKQDHSEKNYLNRCVEVDPEKAGRSHVRKEKLWQVASIASVVGFLIFAASAAVVTSLFFPAYIPLTAIINIGLIELIYQVYAKCKLKADHHGGLAREELGVAKEMKEITKNGGEGTLNALRKLGISFYQIKNHQQLKDTSALANIIARFEFWRKRDIELNQEVEKLLKEKPENPNVIRANRINVYMLKQLAYFAKVKAAFYYGLIFDPFFKGSLEDICTFHSPSLEDRYLEKMYDSSDKFIIFKDKTKGSIGMTELDKINFPDPAFSKRLMSAALTA
jgi:hypothetical protein